MDILDGFYGKHYKKYIALPAVLFVVFAFIAFIYPGIPQGIDLTGGTEIIVHSQTQINVSEVQSILEEEFQLTELTVIQTASGFRIKYSNDPKSVEAEELIIQAENSLDNESESIEYSRQAMLVLNKETQETYANPKLALLAAQTALADYKEVFSQTLLDMLSEKLGLGENVSFQRREVSPTLGSTFYQSGIMVALWSTILVILVVFAFFRKIVPSMAIILAAILDILAAMAGMALFNIPLSLASIPALMMLIGYSVDTDIMLTHRLTKRSTVPAFQRATESMKTGLTMTGTTLAALTAMLLISYFYQIDIIYQIAAVLVFGLIGDLFATWFMNAPILLWYTEKKGGKL